MTVAVLHISVRAIIQRKMKAKGSTNPISRQLLPDGAEFTAKHKTWQCDEQQSREKEWHSYETAQEGSWGDFTVANSRDRWSAIRFTVNTR
jgi:hypothetical protein